MSTVGQQAALALILGVSVGVAGSCGGEDESTTDEAPKVILEPPAEGEGFQISMEMTVPAGTEAWRCKIGRLPAGDSIFRINRAESRQTDNIHHMDVMALALTPIDLPDGEYDCAQIYEDNPVLMEEGIFLYASQIGEQVIQLPEGVVAPVPSEMAYMQEIHFVNSSNEDVDIYSYLNAYTIPAEEMKASIWGGVVRDAHINIPAASEHREWSRCVMNEDVDVIFLSSHTHQLGREVRVRRFDGEAAGEEIYVNNDWHAPQLKDYSPPLKLKKGEGLEFECLFDNSTMDEVKWGFASTDEMCQIGIVHTPGSTTAKCEVVETSDGVIDTTGEGG
jgi:hypothetical protein